MKNFCHPDSSTGCQIVSDFFNLRRFPPTVCFRKRVVVLSCAKKSCLASFPTNFFLFMAFLEYMQVVWPSTQTSFIDSEKTLLTMFRRIYASCLALYPNIFHRFQKVFSIGHVSKNICKLFGFIPKHLS